MKYIISLLLVITIYPFLVKPVGEIEVIEEKKQTENIKEDIKIPSPEEIILDKMTVEEKVGQLFIFGFDGTTLTTENKNFLSESHTGGVLLLGRNIENEQQLTNLINDIQNTNTVPLFIAIDQEGGVVSRIRWNGDNLKSQTDTISKEEAYTIAKNRGELLKTYGINMNLAPVVEYITEPSSFMYNRVFRETKEEVHSKSAYSIQGYIDSGIIPVAKHYPGHGNTSSDPHSEMPHVDISTEDWENYTSPFSNLVKETPLEAIMVGHIKFPNIDTNPATLSYELISERLIKKLEYNGLIITDDMEMSALDNLNTKTEIAKQALLSGNDILIYSRFKKEDRYLQSEIYQFILNEVKLGNIDIKEKVLKILKVKIANNILNPTF